MPFFSVVIPVKDRPQLLYRALDSLRKQTFRDFEVIVVDDNSLEDISRVTGEFPDLDLILLRQAKGKKGACAARNLGGDRATGTYIAYLDSDDIFLPEKLTSVAREIDTSGADLLASSLLVYRGSNRLQLRPLREPIKGEDIGEFYFVADQRIQSSSIIISKKLFLKNRWNEFLKKVQDPDFFIRASKKCARFNFIIAPLAVLFDTELQGRVSNISAEDNLRNWLNSAECPLSEAAIAGFCFYALSHEVAKRSRLEALSLMIKNRHVVSFKIQVKALYRMFAPEWLFKRTAVLVYGKSSDEYNDFLRIIEELNRNASAFV